MADLFPTPARLALLRAVEAGDVIEGITDDHTYRLQEPDEPLKVCARIDEMNRAGWVTLPDGPPVVWVLTEAGRKVLEANGG